MRMRFYTLEQEDIMLFESPIPNSVSDNISEEGYFTLGAVCYTEDGAKLAGMAQFYIGATADEDCYAELVYVYVMDEYRRRSIGVRLVNMADSILASEDVGVFMTCPDLPDPDETSKQDKMKFLTECGFISTRDDIVPGSGEAVRDPGLHRLFRFTGR